MNLTAVFTPGWQSANGDFSCAYTTFVLDGELGFTSDTVFNLVDNHGLDFTEANALLHRLSRLAETLPGTSVAL